MHYTLEELVSKLPSFIQKNKRVYLKIVEKIQLFLEAEGVLEVSENSKPSDFILVKKSFPSDIPYHNQEFNYLELELISETQINIYYGTTKKTINENQMRHSVTNPIKYMCYLNGDGNLHVEFESQSIKDDESIEYPGFLFRTIDALKIHEMYDYENKLVKREKFYGKNSIKNPYLHQAIQSNYVNKKDFEMKIDCLFYVFTNCSSSHVYFKEFYDILQGEKYFLTDINNVNQDFMVLDEDKLIPIDENIWNQELKEVMR